MNVKTLDDIKNGKGTKDDIGKPDYLGIFQYLDLNFLVDVSEVMKDGAKKYTFENWKKDLEPERIEKALLRHFVKYIKGEKIDVESKHSHLSHIVCNAMFLYYYDFLKEVKKNE